MTDPWDDTAKTIAQFMTEIAKLEQADLEASVLCVKLALSVIEARNGRVHESAN